MTKIIYTSVHPHTTWRLKMSYNVKKPPKKLLAALEASGWKQSDWVKPASPLNGVQEIDVAWPGSGNFGSWTAKEREVAMSSARKVLAKHGFDVVPYHQLEMADCL